MYYTSKESIDNIFQYFKDKFPNISEEVLYRRVANHYEGGLFDIWTLEDWDNVFNYTSYGCLLTLFKDWDEYFKYKGDYSKHPKFSINNWHLI